MSRFHIRKRLKKILLNGRAQAVRHHVRLAMRQVASVRPKWWFDIRPVRRLYTSYGRLV